MFRKKKEADALDRTLSEDILDFVRVFAISAIVILLFVNFIAHPVTVIGSSMMPTLQDGEYGFTSVISPTVAGVSRGDIVVINVTAADGTVSRWVKRIIGLPGETIEGRNGQVYINGVVLDESDYLSQEYIDETLAALKAQSGIDPGYFTSEFSAVTLGEDEYFVMGDNRPVSKDSRDPTVGAISGDDIFGSGVLVVWPFSKIGVK